MKRESGLEPNGHKTFREFFRMEPGVNNLSGQGLEVKHVGRDYEPTSNNPSRTIIIKDYK